MSVQCHSNNFFADEVLISNDSVDMSAVTDQEYGGNIESESDPKSKLIVIVL